MNTAPIEEPMPPIEGAGERIADRVRLSIRDRTLVTM